MIVLCSLYNLIINMNIYIINVNICAEITEIVFELESGDRMGTVLLYHSGRKYYITS